jgi:hypothetical protein
MCGPVSSVGIATGYGLDGQGIESASFGGQNIWPELTRGRTVGDASFVNKNL